MSLEQARSLLAQLSQGVDEGEGRIRLELDGPLAHLRLDNPGARNAITLRMMRDLLDAVERLDAWDGSVVLVSSTSDGIFCAGGHLGEVRTVLDSPEAGRQMSLAMGAILDRLLDQPALVVAAVEGVAMGGGSEILTACDFRVFHTGARIHFVHGRLGVAPGWGGTGRLVRHLGRRLALRVIGRSEPLGAEEALMIGLADHVVDGPASEGALAWLAPVLALAPAAARAIKGQVVAAEDRPLEASRAERADLFSAVWHGEAHRAALDGISRKRGSHTK